MSTRSDRCIQRFNWVEGCTSLNDVSLLRNGWDNLERRNAMRALKKSQSVNDSIIVNSDSEIDPDKGGLSPISMV